MIIVTKHRLIRKAISQSLREKMRGDVVEIRAEKTTISLDNAELWAVRSLFERLAREARRPSPDGVSHIVITTQELLMIDQLNANLQQLVP